MERKDFHNLGPTRGGGVAQTLSFNLTDMWSYDNMWLKKSFVVCFHGWPSRATVVKKWKSYQANMTKHVQCIFQFSTQMRLEMTISFLEAFCVWIFCNGGRFERFCGKFQNLEKGRFKVDIWIDGAYKVLQN